MIVQYNKPLTNTKPADLFTYIVNEYVMEQYIKFFVLKSSTKKILEDYKNEKKIMVTDVMPLGENSYDKDALDYAAQLGWEFTLYQDADACPMYDSQGWLSTWDCHKYYDIDEICNYISSKKKDEYTVAFIGYKMKDIFAMYEADYSGTSVDAMKHTKMYCDIVTDRSFNSFAFAELLMHIVKKDVEKFLKENSEKYFVKKAKMF